MIREFAFGLSNRHHFFPTDNSVKWENVAKDTFLSLYGYDDSVIKYFEEKKTLSGYDGDIYLPKEFILDVDGVEIEEAQDKTIKLISMLNNLKVPTNVYFSGRGFHVSIPDTAFKWRPGKNLHLRVKDALDKHGIYELADVSVTDKTRIIRLNNTLNSKSRLWKVFITHEELLNLNGLGIAALANKPRQVEIPVLQCEPVFNIMEREVKKKTFKFKDTVGSEPDPMLYPCIQTMLKGSSYGGRHATALRLGAWLRWRYPENVVRLIMEDWRKRVTTLENPFKKDEMDRLITDCYKGHGGNGYRYGCKDKIMDKHCNSTCTLFKAKKAQGIMSAADMENNLISWLTGDNKPLDLGSLYNKDFPIYPGELVVIQAPPKSMKTMLIQNWVNSFKKPTYFLEMEMSPRQIWKRFIQIEKGWTEEELAKNYAVSNFKLADKFDWLNVDYQACFAVELEKRISLLPTKPEIVIVDHMGLLLSKHRDLNLKMEEIAGALTEVAIKHNVVVFAVSEITKTAMTEGMNIASSRGSFRIAYNASKILSLIPTKGMDGNVNTIAIQTTANRERGSLDVLLKVDGVRIGDTNV
tara:strand:- start:130 stop:1872 length:1743 start_codon:yes stop_codon:yes gene_type:complete